MHHSKVYMTIIRHIWWNHHPYENILWLEKWLMLMIVIMKILMPSFWIRHYCESHPSTKWLFEAYVLLKPIFFLWILWLGFYHHIFFVIITIYFMIDLFSYIVWLLVLSDIFVKPLSVRKNLLLLGANYMEIILWFSILYLYYDSIWYIVHNVEKAVGPLQAIYYSISTFSTVGYGDIASTNDIWIILTIIQLTCSIVFIGIVLSAYVGKIKLKSE